MKPGCRPLTAELAAKPSAVLVNSCPSPMAPVSAFGLALLEWRSRESCCFRDGEALDSLARPVSFSPWRGDASQRQGLLQLAGGVAVRTQLGLGLAPGPLQLPTLGDASLEGAVSDGRAPVALAPDITVAIASDPQPPVGGLPVPAFGGHAPPAAPQPAVGTRAVGALVASGRAGFGGSLLAEKGSMEAQWVVKAPSPPVIICISIACSPFTRRPWPMPMIVPPPEVENSMRTWPLRVITPCIKARDRVIDPLASTILATELPLNRPPSASGIDQMVRSAAGMGLLGLSSFRKRQQGGRRHRPGRSIEEGIHRSEAIGNGQADRQATWGNGPA